MKKFISNGLLTLYTSMTLHIDEAMKVSDNRFIFTQNHPPSSIFPLNSRNPLRDVIHMWALEISQTRDVQEAISVLFNEIPGSRKVLLYTHNPLEEITITYELKPEFKTHLQTILIELRKLIQQPSV